MLRKTLLLPALASALALAACGDSVAPGSRATLRLQLTDAPAEYLASAVVNIGRIEAIPADGAPITVVENGGTFDLLQLQNGVTAELGQMSIPTGVYTQLRLFVESAELTLMDGYTFTNGSSSQSVAVPSGAQSGIKIVLSADGESEGFEIRAGETVLVIDFDVSQNFVMLGSADTPAGIQGYLFTPLLRAVVRDVAGSIAGAVTAPAGVTVEGLTVTGVRTDVADAVPVTTLVAADGSYKLQFLPPGEYSVTVSDAPAGHASSTATPTVGESQDVTGVNLAISPS